MEKFIKKYVKNGVACGISLFILIICLLVIISQNSTEKRMLLADIDKLQLQVVSLDGDRKTLIKHIDELETEADIYLSTLQDMKAYNAKLENKINSLETDIATADFMINDLEIALAELNERLEQQELQNSTTSQD